MKKTALLSKLTDWLKYSELFLSPARLLPGKWRLYEYYTEPGDELIHIEEDEMKVRDHFWEIEFFSDNSFLQRSNLSLKIIEEKQVDKGTWTKAGNYLLLGFPDQSEQKNEFQFAVGKSDLRLLKKNISGKIDVFGFFRRVTMLSFPSSSA